MGFGLDRRGGEITGGEITEEETTNLNPANKSESWAWAAAILGMAAMFYATARYIDAETEALKRG